MIGNIPLPVYFGLSTAHEQPSKLHADIRRGTLKPLTSVGGEGRLFCQKDLIPPWSLQKRKDTSSALKMDTSS